jgi:hypothetical protein
MSLVRGCGTGQGTAGGPLCHVDGPPLTALSLEGVAIWVCPDDGALIATVGGLHKLASVACCKCLYGLGLG